MNYDNSQQYGFNFGLAAAATASQQPPPQNVSSTVYPYTFHGAGELQQQQLQAKVASAPPGSAMATISGKNILYDPQHQLQQQQQFQQQQQLQQQAATFSMVQGGTLVGRQGMFPMATGLQVAQEPLCSPQAMVDVYGSLSPNMMAQKVTSTAAASATGYKNFTNWMSIPQAITNNIGSNTGNTNAVVSTNNQSALPSFGHLWSHFQQQQQQKQQTAVTTFIQPPPQHQQPQPQQHQPGIANFQSVQVFQSSPAALQVSPGGLQVSPGGLHVSPGSMQVSPGGQTFQVPQSLQGTLSPNPLATAGVSFSGLRQVQMSGAVGSGIRNQVVMAPRGQVIMAQTFPTTAAAFGFNGDMKTFQPVARLPSAGPFTTMTTSTSANHHIVTTATAPSVSAPTTVSAVNRVEVSKEISPSACSQVALTTTTVTVTTSACSLNTTMATTVHVSVPVTTTISVLPNVNTSSCEHIHPTTPLSCLASDGDAKDESGRGSVSPSTPSTAASMSTQESTSGDSEKHELHTVKVPYSWRRVVENGTVHYFSPSDARLSSFEDIRTYLSQSNTCKCGLECPLIVERTFSFDPTLDGKAWSMEDVTCSQDLTKLCNHKRKVLALAAFQSSTAGQDSHSKSDGPSAKCRKREKGKRGDNLLVSPLVVDSKLKTSITNAVNKHAAASALNLNNGSSNMGPSQPAPAPEVIGGVGSVQSTSAGQNADNAVHIHAVSQMSSAPPNCVVDRSGSIHYPSPSPMAHSPASMRSTPGVPLAGDHMEGHSPMPNQFTSKMELGRNHASLGPGMRIGTGSLGPNHVDPRAFQQSAVQCNVFSQDEIKQSYFMQQQLQQHQPPHPHPPNQFNACSMPVMASQHQGPPFGAQTFRAVSPLGMQSQYPVGFPHGQHQQQSSQHLYPQHNYPMVYQMSPQQQQHVHPQHQPHPPQNLHHHHQPPAHPMFQNVRMSSQWPPQHPPPHHTGPAPPPGYHPDPHQLHGSGVFTGMYPQAGELMWLETGKPKSKRPRSKKDKQKLNSIVDRTSPCDASVKLKMGPPAPATAAPVVSKCLMPSTTTSTMPALFPTTASTTTLPCSVSFLENPAIFVAQQTAIINNSLASCHIDLNSPTNPPSNNLYPKLACDNICTIPNSVPTVKVELDCEEKISDASFTLKQSENVECKKEPDTHLQQQAEAERSVNVMNNPETPKSPSSALTVNCNNNQLVVSKNEPDLPSFSTSVSLGVDCSCGTGGESVSLLQSRKKASPKSKSRAKTVLATTKASSATPVCLPDFVPPAVHQQHGSVQQQVQQQQTVGDVNIAGTVPFQISDMSQLLAAGGGNSNWNLLSLQQALAQYASVGAGNGSGLSVGSENTAGSGIVEFPASSLLTAAARAQLSQQASLGSFLLPAFLSAGGQDVSVAAAGAVHPQQHAQQPEQPSAGAQNNNSGTDLGVKSANTVVATGLVGVNPVSVASINQTGHLPVQLVQGTNVASAGVVPAGPFHSGALLAQGIQGVQAVQGLPLNVVLPVNQQLLGLADPMQGFSVDMSGNVVASVSLGTAVCKSLHVSPKIVTTMVDSIAAVSPGANVTVFSSMGSVPSGFSQQGCESIKGTGSTIHHLPQNSAAHGLSIGQNIGQNVSHTTGQSAAQTLGQTLSQNVGQSVGQNICPSLSASVNPVNPNVAQNVGVNVSLGLGAGETVMLNSLLPSILAFNTPMPPISLPMVTNVTNSLTQVIPAAGTTPALLAQQQQQQQQQQATAQFLNALAIPAVAAAALNPLLIAHPSPVPTSAVSPGAQFPAKPAEGMIEDKECPVDSVENKPVETEQPDEGEESTNQKPDDTAETAGGDTVRMVDLSQGNQPQILSMAAGDHTQQQVIVLPGGGLPLMQVLSNGPHTLGTTQGMMDKLCNTTQVFLPTAPPAATLPDLAQLGTVAALTPLGIQQMWNSLNSLQLQQLQTLQLQQLVWQQLQGMQALPHHLQTVDACTTGGGGQSIPMQFYPSVQQLHSQQHASGQQQVQVTVSHSDPGNQDEEEMQDDNLFANNLNTSSVATEKDNADDSSVSAQADDCLDGGSRKPTDGSGEEKTDKTKPGQKARSTSNNRKSPLCMQKSGTSTAATYDAKCIHQNLHPQETGHTTPLPGSRSKKCFQSHSRDLKLSEEEKGVLSAAGDLETNHFGQHLAVNGDCLGTERHVGGSVNRRRGVKRGLDDRCIAAGSSKGLSGAGSVGLMGVPVMSGPAPKLVGQGPCSM